MKLLFKELLFALFLLLFLLFLLGDDAKPATPWYCTTYKRRDANGIPLQCYDSF